MFRINSLSYHSSLARVLCPWLVMVMMRCAILFLGLSFPQPVHLLLIFLLVPITLAWIPEPKLQVYRTFMRFMISPADLPWPWDTASCTVCDRMNFVCTGFGLLIGKEVLVVWQSKACFSFYLVLYSFCFTQCMEKYSRQWSLTCY